MLSSSALMCVFLYLEHPCSSTPDQRRGVHNPIPQNGQQQFVVRWVGAEREYNYFVHFFFFFKYAASGVVLCLPFFSPQLHEGRLQAVQGCVGQRQGCHHVLQEAHQQLAILLLLWTQVFTDTVRRHPSACDVDWKSEMRNSCLIITRQHSGGVDGHCGFGENVVSR